MKPIGDPERTLLIRIFSDRASNVVVFTQTAKTGGKRSDEGYENVIAGPETPREKEALVRDAVLRELRSGQGKRKDETGDTTMQFDDATYYEFRPTIRGAALYVKVTIEDAESDDPRAIVVSVKRNDSR